MPPRDFSPIPKSWHDEPEPARRRSCWPLIIAAVVVGIAIITWRIFAWV